MSIFQVRGSGSRILREMALSADLAAWAGEDDRCTAIIARIYDGYDDLFSGLVPQANALAVAAEGKAWIEGRHSNREVLGRRVLFAEDDMGIRLCTSEILRDEGYEVMEVDSGDAAAHVLETESFDLLLTDVRMPGSKDGLDLAAHARRQNPTLPIVVITGFAENVATRVRELGQNVKLVRKPFSSQELMGALLGVAEQARARVIP